MSRFYIGQKVKCINDDWYMQLADGQVIRPEWCVIKKDGVYTVIEHTQPFGKPFIKLLEEPKKDSSFDEAYFAPIFDRDTDISVFKELLINPDLPIKEDERERKKVLVPADTLSERLARLRAYTLRRREADDRGSDHFALSVGPQC